MEPSVSVILPFRQSASTIANALDSILVQSFSNFELLAIDDGSLDSSSETVLKVASGDPRIRLLRPGRIGLVRALNLGLRQARAPLVARMDADDVMYPERLELQFQYMMDHPEVDLVSSKVELISDKEVTKGLLEYLRWQDSCLSPEDIETDIYIEAPFVHPTVMMRRDVVVNLGGYREGPFPEDYELWLRMIEHGCKMAKIPRVLLKWRDHPRRLTRVDSRYSKEAFDLLRANYLAKDKRLWGERGFAIWGAGRRSRQRARLIIERGLKPLAWIDVDPKKIGREIWGIRVQPMEWLAREPRPFVLVYVRVHGAREEIKRNLELLGYKRGEDYLFVG